MHFVAGKSREVTVRRVSSSERNIIPDELPSFLEQDIIPSTMDTFIDECHRTALITDHKPVMYREGDDFCLAFISESHLYARVIVHPNFTISCYAHNTKVGVRDLLGFQCKLEKWSQLEAVISRSKVSQVDLKEEIAHGSKILRLHVDNSSEVSEKIDFLLNQMEILGQSSRGRTYTTHQVLLAARLYFASRVGFKHARQFMSLPHPSTIKRYLGRSSPADELDYSHMLIRQAVEAVKLKHFSIIVDEIHVKPSVRFRGSHVIGKSIDAPTEVAKTVLAVMVKPLADGKAFMARLLPISHLKPEFLFEQIEIVIGLVVLYGGHVDAIVADNHMTNRRCFALYQSEPSSPWIGFSNAGNSSVILLYDSVHLMKSFRNNWITEGRQELQLKLPQRDEPCLGEWKHICSIETDERDSAVRCTVLDFVSCHLSPIERQKMKLFLNVFNEKTIAALEIRNRKDTASILSTITKLWKMFNVKNASLHIRLADDDRKPFSCLSDSRLDFMKQMALNFKSLPGGRGPFRKRSLTSETRDALYSTLMGTASLIEKLLASGFKFVLTAKFQSDDLEGEFGVYRQLSGGTYFVGVEQVLSSANIRAKKFLVDLESCEAPHHIERSCCSDPITAAELDLIDQAMENPDDIPGNEATALYYICGYITLKEKLDAGAPHSEFSDFTTLVSRGRLQYPSEHIFYLGKLLYNVFLLTNPVCCNRFCDFSEIVYNAFFDCVYERPRHIFRRFGNCFFKGLSRKESGYFDVKTKLDSRKRAKFN